MIRSLAVLVALIIIALLIVMQMMGKSVKDIIDFRTEVQKAIMRESEEDVERIAAFVTHATCSTNRKSCAGSKAEWLTLCAFLGSQKHTGASNTANFQDALPLVPNPKIAPYIPEWGKNIPFIGKQLEGKVPFLKLRLTSTESWFAKSVMQTIDDTGHLDDFRRIRDEIVLPFLKSGRDNAMIPGEYRQHCNGIVKMVRSDLAKLKKRGWKRPKLLADMKTAGYEEVARVTDADARKSQPRPGRVHRDDFIFYRKVRP